MRKVGFVYFFIALFCILFAAVYEHFSHQVYSNYMIYTFMFPLFGGALPFAVIFIFGKKHTPGRLSFNLYNSGIAALTVGSILKGVLEIYGTSNGLISVYWFVGFGLAGIGLLIYIAEWIYV